MSDYNDMPDWMRPVDQAAEHWAHEENARYDRYDGWGDPDYCGDQADMAPCRYCGAIQGRVCDGCTGAIARMKELEQLNREKNAARNARENDPNSPDYIPF